MTSIETAPLPTATELGLRPISDLTRADVAFAGGKGANLGELTAAGLPVPPGFVIGAPTYAAFVDGTGLRDRIEARLADVDVDDSAALEAAAHEVRALVDAEPVPDEIAAAIRASYEELVGDDEDAPVAVRSSATAEDTEAASFAGMNETFLNTRGADDVLSAVRRCWSSLFGARTIFYRAKRGFGQADMDIAVVVQRQIESERAGVMFTIDPASGSTDRLVIEGSFGLGEAVVSGRVSPDRFVVDKETLSILVREIHPKEAVIESRPAAARPCVSSAARRRSGRRSRTTRSATSPSSAGRSSATTARRKTPSGRSTRPARSGCSSRGPSPLQAER